MKKKITALSDLINKVLNVYLTKYLHVWVREASIALWLSCSPSKPGFPGFYSLSDEILNRGPMTIFQDKLLTRTDCDESGDYVVPNVLSQRDLVFRLDIGQKLYQHRMGPDYRTV